MRFLTAIEMLDVWDLGQALPSTRQALALLRAACPEESAAELARLTIGRRDARLLTLREWAFGSELRCQASCPVCAERFESTVHVGEIRREPGEPVFEMELGGYRVACRVPSSEDLVLVESA